MARISAGAYRSLARAVARTLGRCEHVRSVSIRRSVAAGEVAFGRSDIDLRVVVDEPGRGASAGRRSSS